MPKYVVEVEETQIVKYIVEAVDEDRARRDYWLVEPDDIDIIESEITDVWREDED